MSRRTTKKCSKGEKKIKFKHFLSIIKKNIYCSEKNNKKQLKQEYKERLKQIDEEFEFDYGDDDTNAEIDDEEDF